MFRNDYVMRMIEQLSSAMGVILGLKRQLKPEEALQLLEETYKRLFGLNPNLIRALSERDLTDLLNRQGEATAEKMLVVARLMKEEAELYSTLDRVDESHRLNRKALHITLTAAQESSDVPWLDIGGQVDELLDRLRPYGLPAETRRLLWAYYASVGRFADAEDYLFQLLQETPQTAEEQSQLDRLLADADSFYERLLTLDEEVLEAGRLPLDEVKDSLEEIRALTAARDAGKKSETTDV
ncbi:DUF6483 family protein [Paenibacillus hodogayensis]|uniref:DUF6483 family protein n=1 Tax=Paenibacillus hodogayensis TaxID=279208 RepID=A0ABV5W1F7_9BACL